VSCYFLEATAFAKLFVQDQGTGALISLMEAVEDNRKLISASTPLEVYGAIRRRERAGAISAEDATSALDSLRMEAARMVQEPLNRPYSKPRVNSSTALRCAGPTLCNWPPLSSPATCSRTPNHLVSPRAVARSRQVRRLPHLDRKGNGRTSEGNG